MDERKKFILTVIVGLAGLFFLFTNFCLPLAKDNIQRAAQYRQLKTEVGAIEEFSKGELDSLDKRIDTAISSLEKKFPPEGKLKLMEQLTRVPENTHIVFTDIAQREPVGREGYQVFPVEVNMKAPFYDLIRYLAKIEASPLMIDIYSLSLRKVEPEAKSLEIKITFSGFRLVHKFPPMSSYVGKRYEPFDRQGLEKMLEPVKPPDSERVISLLKDYNPFVFGNKLEKEVDYPEHRMMPLESLSLKGILHIADEKAALINDTIIKEGETILGIEVVEIQDDRVVVQQSGQRYILKMGVESGLIKY